MATPTFIPGLIPTVFPQIPEMSLKEFFETVSKSRDICIDWLRANGLLAREMTCKCRFSMRECIFSNIADGQGWRCPQKHCKKIANLRAGSFFEGSNLPLTELVEFLYFWVEGLQSTHFLQKNLRWSPNTITDWKNLDESKFGKRKYHRGRQLSGKWVFGEIDRDTKDLFMVVVENRSASLLQVLKLD